MECEKVRDRFSSLWEGELPPSEEKIFKDHLSSCPTCQKEFEQFEKTMGWVQSAGDVEVPEGFLRELRKKLEEKKRAAPGQKLGKRRFHVPLSFKLPVQAVAMVVVVFLVLYLTKMIPTEGIRLKETKPTPSPLSVQEKPDAASRQAPPGPVSGGEGAKGLSESPLSDRSRSVREAPPPERSQGAGRGAEGLTQKEMKGELGAREAPPEPRRRKDGEQSKALVSREARLEKAPVPQMEAGAKKREAPVRSEEVLGHQAVDSAEAARAGVPSPEPPKIDKELAVSGKTRVPSKPPQEIILRISDREKVIPLLHELVKQFGGEVIATRGDRVLASVPTGSFREFEKELAEISSSSWTDRLAAKKQATESLSLEEGMKRKERDEQGKETAKLAANAGSRRIVRILLVDE
jgi:hypothetical protein